MARTTRSYRQRPACLPAVHPHVDGSPHIGGSSTPAAQLSVECGCVPFSAAPSARVNPNQLCENLLCRTESITGLFPGPDLTELGIVQHSSLHDQLPFIADFGIHLADAAFPVILF